jgi:phytol kinase
MIALMLMCGGDGLADIIGRRYGKTRLPWNAQKSWMGSAAMLLGGLFFAIAITLPFIYLDYFPITISTFIPRVTLIALAATLVETMPLKDLDNLTITITAVLLGEMLF